MGFYSYSLVIRNNVNLQCRLADFSFISEHQGCQMSGAAVRTTTECNLYEGARSPKILRRRIKNCICRDVLLRLPGLVYKINALLWLFIQRVDEIHSATARHGSLRSSWKRLCKMYSHNHPWLEVSSVCVWWKCFRSKQIFLYKQLAKRGQEVPLLIGDYVLAMWKTGLYTSVIIFPVLLAIILVQVSIYSLFLPNKYPFNCC